MAETPSSDVRDANAIPPDLMQRCHENFVEAIRTIARAVPNGRIEEQPGVVRIASGVPIPDFNTVFVTRVPTDPTTVIEASSSFMARASVPAWRVLAFPGAESGIEGAALSAGLRADRAIPGMVLDPVPTRPPSLPPGLRIRRVRDRALWGTMVRVMMRGFAGEAPEDTENLLPFGLASVFRGYVGFVGRTPVATSVGLSHRGIGGVFSVATLAEFRGKGYGTALTWQALVAARRDGCRASYLESSDAGYPVYTRMGYRKVASYSIWVTSSS